MTQDEIDEIEQRYGSTAAEYAERYAKGDDEALPHLEREIENDIFGLDQEEYWDEYGDAERLWRE